MDFVLMKRKYPQEIQYAYLILAYVGTWRSASNYKPKKDQWSWGTIAKVYIILNLIRAVGYFFR